LRRQIVAAIACASLAACGVQTAPETSRANGRPAVRLVVLGDSLAFGTGASEPTGGFAFRLYDRIARERPGSEITSYAIGGTTIADVERLEVARLHGTHPDAILLCVGGNDVVRRTDPAVFAASYTRTVAAIHTNAPHAKLILFGVPNIAVSPLFADFDAAAVERLSRADDRAVRATATRTHASFVDLFTLSSAARHNVGFFSSDQFHPSDDGHERIARYALPALERALHS